VPPKKTLVPQSLAESSTWISHHRNVGGILDYWIAEGYLPVDFIVDADVLDLGGGYGSLAVLLLERGARSVTVLDPDLSEEFYRQHFSLLEGIKYHKGTIELFEERGQFDLVTASSVTEHILDLARCLRRVYGVLRAGGSFFTSHDNYYHPSGAHDYFMFRQDSRGYEYAGPDCWATSEKCESSREFRSTLATSSPWAWGEAQEMALTPLNCDACPLFKRARPWAHLLYADEFNKVFDQEFFTTGRAGSGLNKVTPFMLRQFMVEAGFSLELWHRNFVANEPPPALLCEPHWHNAMDLRTLNILARGKRVS
jgi:2-polyprenyl-6-hydroxyphenyl methylase/3-demethylubiquinone-9 3-methyltransferase